MPDPQTSLKLKIIFISLAVLLLLVVAARAIFKTKPPTTQPEPVLVAGFPQVPTYPNSRLLQSKKADDQYQFTYSATWVSSASLPQISKWFLENIAGSGWELNIPPADTTDTNTQYIRLSQGDNFLSISLIADPKSGTQIIMETSNQAMQQAGEEEEEE